MVRFDVLPIILSVPFSWRYQSLSGLLIIRGHNINRHKPCNRNTCAIINRRHVMWLACWLCWSAGISHGSHVQGRIELVHALSF